MALVPVLRSSVLERNDGRVELRYLAVGPDVDPALPMAGVRPTSVLGLARELLLHPPDVLELPEPMWYRAWPVALLAGLLARLRRRSRVVSLAIENLPVHEGLSSARTHLPHLLSRLMRATWGFSTLVLHDVAFGTVAARRNYAAGVPRTFRRWTAPVIVERTATCDCWDGRAEAEPVVLFLAEFAPRKGVHVLQEAWGQLPPHCWTLHLCGFGEGLEDLRRWALERSDVRLETSPPRARQHELLRRSSVVVLPSVPVPGWREQVGLPLLEGAAHGCRLICSDSSGAASGVTASGGAVVRSGDLSALTRALEQVTSSPAGKTAAATRQDDSRRAFELWARGLPS
ncbi:MAG: glycosyltransferase [Frankiales bacterium]|nr:glycosyltransferase [Frankiales bacterium]